MKAIALLSGGLDSTLGIRIVLDQGIEVEAVNFVTPFCLCSRKIGCGSEAKMVAAKLDIKVKLFSISTQYLGMLKNPKYGYGRNLNPCIDCRILMLRRAGKYMDEVGASFLITGEVLGQRPMSQHRKALKIIESESGFQGLILRPLSARLLPPSIPEKEGWVNRERLLAISGRSRKPQMTLAKDYSIGDYLCPAGGCLLTDSGFAHRMKDSMTHSEITLREINLLKIGRHFRLSPQAKLIVGRNKEENERLLKLAEHDDICFKLVEIKGPIGIGQGSFGETTIILASRTLVRYSDAPGGEVFGEDPTPKRATARIEHYSSGKIDFLTVDSISDEQLNVFRI